MSASSVSPAGKSSGARTTVLEAVWRRNPIAAQVLGVCSALAVTRQVETALVMGAAVTFVCAMTGLVISLLRALTPSRIRLITWMCLIATFVILVDQLCKAFLWDISLQLGPYVGLIITNCIILGRAESFASRNAPLLSTLDGAATGLGYAAVLLLVAVARELLGTGRIELTHLVGKPVVLARLWTSYVPSDFLLLASGAFIVLGLLVAAFNHLVGRRAPNA
jgi:Na+-transporting NADH:ubiquinone oxidoreductase subunit D